MDLAERIELTRGFCREALESAELGDVDRALERAGFTAATLRAILRQNAERKQPAPDLLSLRAKLAADGVLSGDRATFERTVLLRAAQPALDEVAALRVEESVKQLICKELAAYARPTPAMLPLLTLESRAFAAMCGIVAVTRFPAGQYQWVVSGMPRSWLAKVPLRKLPAVCRFLAFHARGFRPFFVPHLGGTLPPAGLVTERQYQKSFYRMTATVEQQPKIKGIMAVSWMHSRETHRVSPHLAFYNRPYMEVGGLYVDLGPADSGDGFLAGDPRRAELYRDGAYRPTHALVLCSREQAIAWLQAHRDLGTEVSLQSQAERRPIPI
jgi:hypothetical protein